MKKGFKRICTGVLVASLMITILPNQATAAKKMSVKLNKKSVSVYVGKTTKLKATIKNKKKKSKIVWKSSNKKVATINSKGLVKGIKAGKANITAQIKGTSIKAICKVTIKKANSTVKPTAAPTVKPTTEPTAAPTTEPTPVPSEEPTTPGVTPTEAPVPTASSEPAENNGLVKYVGLTEDGNTVYLINKKYKGNVTVSINGYSRSMSVLSGSGLLAMIASCDFPTPRTFGDSFTVQRTSTDEGVPFIITDLKTNETYAMGVSQNNNYDQSYTDCGTIYISGDARGKVSITSE